MENANYNVFRKTKERALMRFDKIQLKKSRTRVAGFTTHEPPHSTQSTRSFDAISNEFILSLR
jgi:ribosomal protein S17E